MYRSRVSFGKLQTNLAQVGTAPNSTGIDPSLPASESNLAEVRGVWPNIGLKRLRFGRFRAKLDPIRPMLSQSWSKLIRLRPKSVAFGPIPVKFGTRSANFGRLRPNLERVGQTLAFALPGWTIDTNIAYNVRDTTCTPRARTPANKLRRPTPSSTLGPFPQPEPSCASALARRQGPASAVLVRSRSSRLRLNSASDARGRARKSNAALRRALAHACGWPLLDRTSAAKTTHCSWDHSEPDVDPLRALYGPATSAHAPLMRHVYASYTRGKSEWDVEMERGKGEGRESGGGGGAGPGGRVGGRGRERGRACFSSTRTSCNCKCKNPEASKPGCSPNGAPWFETTSLAPPHTHRGEQRQGAMF